VGRPFIAPPGVPEDRLKILRSAFAQTMKDPGLVMEAEAAGLHPLYISPEELQKFVADAYKMSPEIVALTKKAMGH
jgi:tripartite-type tricarboxylate transporter receptor subunit TctC